MRQIDADALIKWLDQNDKLFQRTYTAQDLKEMLRKGCPTIPSPGWVSVKEALPKASEKWQEYNVNVCHSHWPTSSYDIVDSPYSTEFVTSALFDAEQKIWHLQHSETQLNALFSDDDVPLNGMVVTHWAELPEPPKDESEVEDDA